MSLNLVTLLKQQSLVSTTAPVPEEIERGLLVRHHSGKTIRVMYGETYDRLGLTVDALKYYFFVAAVGWTLRRQDIKVEPIILIADVATCRNEPKEQHDKMMALGQKRAAVLRTIGDVYNLGISGLLMSQYLYSEDFQTLLHHVREQAEQHDGIYQWIRQTVPESKVGIEAAKNFAYAFEEVATIMSYDLKVGPPREVFYDEPARQIGETLGYLPLLSVYLHPTFPLGLGRSFFFANEEIAQCGVTAYKAGSKGLNAHRIIVGQTSSEDLTRLVNQSVVSPKPTIPNPVLDLAVIAEMAQDFLDGELKPIDLRERFYRGDLSVEELKDRAINGVDKYLLAPLATVAAEVLV